MSWTDEKTVSCFQILVGCGATVANFFDFLSMLNVQGILLKKSSKVYQFLKPDC